MTRTLLITGAMMLALAASGPVLAQQSETLDSKSTDATKASELPLDKVCLQRSNIYSAGAVVTMNEKPYVCKMDKNSGTGTLSWVPMESKS